MIGLTRFLRALYEYRNLWFSVSGMRFVRLVMLRVLANRVLLIMTVLLTLAFMLTESIMFSLCLVLHAVLFRLRVFMLLTTRIGRLAMVVNVLQTCRLC